MYKWGVVRIGSIIICHLSKLWTAKFIILRDVKFLVRLRGDLKSVTPWVGYGAEIFGGKVGPLMNRSHRGKTLRDFRFCSDSSLTLSIASFSCADTRILMVPGGPSPRAPSPPGASPAPWPPSSCSAIGAFSIWMNCSWFVLISCGPNTDTTWMPSVQSWSLGTYPPSPSLEASPESNPTGAQTLNLTQGRGRCCIRPETATAYQQGIKYISINGDEPRRDFTSTRVF